MVAVTVDRIIAVYLDKLGLPYRHYPQQRLFSVKYLSRLGKEIPVMISYSRKWVKFFVHVYDEKEIPAYVDREILYRRLLEENFYTYGVTFSITDKGHIIIEREISVNSLENIGIFKTCLLSLLSGINYFMKEILKL